jgi:hypothetical protein
LGSFQQRPALLDLPIRFKVCFPMGVSSRTVTAAGIILLTLILNLLSGYFRGGSGKYSLKWFRYSRLPVPDSFPEWVQSGLDYQHIPFLSSLQFQSNM